jgi:hypothetical protein
MVINLFQGMMSTAASLGLSLLWDTEVGLSHIDKYTYSAEEHIKVSDFFQKLCTVKFLILRPARLVLCSPQECSTLVFGHKVILLLVCLENTLKTSQYH